MMRRRKSQSPQDIGGHLTGLEQFEEKIGSNAEMKSLTRFVPAYFTTVREWLEQRKLTARSR